MSSVENLIEKFASTGVDENQQSKVVSFAGQSLKLNTEADASVIVEAIRNCPGMTTLCLEGNTVAPPAAKIIAGALEDQTSFSKALWKDMFTGRDKEEVPEALKYLTRGIMTSGARLTVLDLSDNAFGPRGLVGLQKFLQSPCCFTLQELHLHNNGLGITGAKMLSEAILNGIENSRKQNTPMQLKIFVCGRNRLENEGSIAVSKFLKELKTLESVTMPQNGINPPGIEKLSDAFKSNPNLKVINLEDNTVKPEGAKYIAECFPLLPNLQMLNLGDCLVKTVGAAILAAALKENCRDLINVNLGFNEIDYAGGFAIVDSMTGKKNLQSLILNGNHFGDQGCEHILRQAMELGFTDQLGSLSEDEGDDIDEEDEDEVSFSENEEEEDDENEDAPVDKKTSEESAFTSPIQKVSVADFMVNPTPDVLISLHKSGEDFTSALGENPTLEKYLDVFVKISMAVTLDNEESKTIASVIADKFLATAYSIAGDVKTFNDALLVAMHLVKNEKEKYKAVIDISGTLLVLEHLISQPYIDFTLRDMFKFFMSMPFQYVTASVKAKHAFMQRLYQI